MSWLPLESFFSQLHTNKQPVQKLFNKTSKHGRQTLHVWACSVRQNIKFNKANIWREIFYSYLALRKHGNFHFIRSHTYTEHDMFNEEQRRSQIIIVHQKRAPTHTQISCARNYHKTSKWCRQMVYRHWMLRQNYEVIFECIANINKWKTKTFSLLKYGEIINRAESCCCVRWWRRRKLNYCTKPGNVFPKDEF